MTRAQQAYGLGGSGALDRRTWLQYIAAHAAAGTLLGGTAMRALAAEPAAIAPLNRFPRMVHDFTLRQVRRLSAEAQQQRDALQTRDDAQEYVAMVREKIKRSFGPLPKKTPLKAQVTGKLERSDYTVEKVIFESRPGFMVTANLYVPRGLKQPAPGVVGTCGHSTNGKASEAYQSFCQALARQGYVVLIYDPIGQGERLQYVDEHWQPRKGTGTSEHLYAGNQQFLVGEFFGTWRAWDGIRALDYLLTRPEVDAKHVGVTGNSGGGTMTTWLCGVEPRWTMAAPSCFVTTFQRNLENELPADTEQCPPEALALGLDHSDFLAAQAPDPIIVIAQEKDYFDVRGAREAYVRLRQLYKLFDAEDQVRMFIGSNFHGYHQDGREAMVDWFNRATNISQTSAEGPMEIEKDEDLWCTPHGQVAELKSRTVYSFTRESAEACAEARGKLAGDELRKAIAAALRLPPRAEKPPRVRILRPLTGRQHPLACTLPYVVETEPDAAAVVYRLYAERHYSRPPRSQQPAIVYVSHLSADDELRGEPLVKQLLDEQAEAAFYACDVRGIGESIPGTSQAGSFHSPYGNDYFYAAHGLMLGRPMLGQRTLDLLRSLDWIASHGHASLHLVGNGWGAVVAALAGVLSEHVTQVTLQHGLTSYHELASAEEYHCPLALMPHGVLKHFDLPDCYAELEKHKQLKQMEPWGPLGETG